MARGIGNPQNVVIQSGGSLSPWFRIGDQSIASIEVPNGWGTTTPADMTFMGSASEVDDANASNLTGASVFNADNTEYTVKLQTLTAAHIVPIPPGIFYGMNWIRLRSGTVAAPVNQVDQRTLIVDIRPV